MFLKSVMWQWLLMGMAAVLAGCQASPSPTSPPARASRTADPCAESLHEISGALLMYYATNNRLPQELKDLTSVGLNAKYLSCPATGKPYVYLRKGIRVVDQPGWVIVYDAAPHRNVRWTINANLKGSDALIARVIGVPEGKFLMLPEHPVDMNEGPPPDASSP